MTTTDAGVHGHSAIELQQPPNPGHLENVHGLTWLGTGRFHGLAAIYRQQLHQALHPNLAAETHLNLVEAASLRTVLRSMPYTGAAHLRLTSRSVMDPMSLGRHDALVTVADVIADLVRLRTVLQAAAQGNHRRDLLLGKYQGWARAWRELLTTADLVMPPLPPDPATADQAAQAEEGAPTT